MNLSTNRTYDVVQIHDEGSLVAEMYGGSFEERVERGHLLCAASEMAEVLKAYERWEADVILSDEAWGGGLEPLPTIPQHLWDRLVEIQQMRNAALRKARGEDGRL